MTRHDDSSDSQYMLKYRTIWTANEITKITSLVTESGTSSISRTITFPARRTGFTIPPVIDPSLHGEWAKAVQRVKYDYDFCPYTVQSILRGMYEDAAKGWRGLMVERLEHFLDDLPDGARWS